MSTRAPPSKVPTGPRGHYPGAPMGPPASRPANGPRGQQRTFARAANSAVSRAGNGLLQQASTRYAQSRTPNLNQSITPAAQQVNQDGTAALVQGMAGLKVDNNNNAGMLQTQVFAPTLGPPPSYRDTILVPPGTAWAPSTAANHSVTPQNQHTRRGWFRNQICVTSGYNKSSFKVGDVIAVPYHKANLIPTARPADEVNITSVGPVYSKRRMFIVLWLTEEEMFCLPLYSWNQVGIEKKRHVINDYVCVGNWKYRHTFVSSGTHKPIWFVHRFPDGELTSTTTCHIAGGKHVEFREDISYVGRITGQSYGALMELWEERNEEFRTQPLDFPPEGDQDPRWESQKVRQQVNQQTSQQPSQQPNQWVAQRARQQTIQGLTMT
ncbi:hypothetical protein BST61_g4503 [Cercospora zeina]